MPLTSYCKKCGKDVPVGSLCPDCGSKLAPNAVRLAWCVEHRPVADWMCWNAVIRLICPVLGMTLLLVILLEALMGGLTGVAALLSGGLLASLLGIIALLLAGMLLVFILQGEDLLDCVIDGRGLHVQTYLPRPTALKLLLRGKSPRLADSGEEMLLLSSREIGWKDVRRVQLWPEKTMILLYAPRWWLRLPLPCTPFTWEDALAFIRDKIGRKKDVILPEECRQAAPARVKSAKPAKTKQLTFEDVPPDDPVTGELEGDFTSLQDVLEEIRESENP